MCDFYRDGVPFYVARIGVGVDGADTGFTWWIARASFASSDGTGTVGHGGMDTFADIIPSVGRTRIAVITVGHAGNTSGNRIACVDRGGIVVVAVVMVWNVEAPTVGVADVVCARDVVVANNNFKNARLGVAVAGFDGAGVPIVAHHCTAIVHLAIAIVVQTITDLDRETKNQRIGGRTIEFVNFTIHVGVDLAIIGAVVLILIDHSADCSIQSIVNDQLNVGDIDGHVTIQVGIFKADG